MLFEGLFKGVASKLSSDKDGNVVATVSHSLHGNDVLAGRVFAATTASAGVAPGTALGGTGAYTLANPLGSGLYGVVMQGAMGYISGTLGAGTVVWAATADPQLPLPTGTAITPMNMLVGGRRAGAQMLAFTTSTITTPTMIRPAWNMDASLATTAGIGGYTLTDHVNGSIVVAPGASVTIHGITASAAGTPRVIFGTIWEEVTI